MAQSTLEQKLIDRIGEIKQNREELVKAANQQLSQMNGVMIELAGLLGDQSILPEDLRPQTQPEALPASEEPVE